MKHKKFTKWNITAAIMSAFMLSAAALTGCTQQTADATEETTAAAVQVDVDAETTDSEASGDETVDPASVNIKIVYTNDIHSYIYNTITDKDKNEHSGLRLSKIKAMVDDMRAAGDAVALVDAGDEVQGAIYGAFDEGKTVIELMNAAGYQAATPGNHEFDYGSFRFFQIVEDANYPFLSCNFRSTKSKEIVLPPYEVIELGDKRVAFVGITTPETITSSTPVYFQDEKGEYIYTIEGLSDPKDLYVSVQNAIDRAKTQADYVIGLGHIGDSVQEKNAGIGSSDIIANTSGLDAFIDGHTHITMEKELIPDRDGNEVVLTQTGSYLGAVGIMEIAADGTINTRLVTDYEREDETLKKMEDAAFDAVNALMGEKIAELRTTLTIMNPNDGKQRLIRSREMNIGDFAADSTYWFFNQKLGIDCDFTIINGGGVRSTIEAGDVTYLSAKNVEPFGNQICLIEVSGQQILDALEMGSQLVGQWDTDRNCPSESGGFLHVAGLRYTIDGDIPSAVKLDEKGMFLSVDGDKRVTEVSVYNKESGEYEALDPEKIYRLGGINYTLRHSGDGFSMFNDCEMVVDYVGQDCDILAAYMKSFKVEGEYPVVTSENSPLRTFPDYRMDYENPYGSGRINIIHVKNEE